MKPTPKKRSKPAVQPAKPPPAPPSAPPAPPQTELDEKTLALIMAADLANIVKKVKAGKPLSQAERDLLHTRSAKTELTAQQTPMPTPGRKPTASEIEARVDLVGVWLATGSKRAETHKRGLELWGCCWQTIDRYARRAREAAIKALREPKENHLATAVAFNEAIIHATDASWSEKLAASKDRSELLGLYPPKTIREQNLDKDGKPTDPVAAVTNQTIIYLPQKDTEPAQLPTPEQPTENERPAVILPAKA